LNVLLTGGLGYLGGRLAQVLAAEPYCELALATRRAGCADLPVPNARLVSLDWGSDAALEQACGGIDAVVHLAGMNAADCARDPIAALEFNGVGTARLARAAAGQRVRRFVYVSSAHVYGTALRGCVDELTCPEPVHPYATSRRAAEDGLRQNRGGTLETVIVRLSNGFGAPASPTVDCWSLVTNDLCRQAVTTRRAVLRSGGQQRRDFVPLAEACRAIAHLLMLPAARLGDGLFNVGGDWAPTMLEMAELIAARVAAVLGYRPQVVAGEAREDIGAELREYSVARLLATGFALRSGAVVEELDRLVGFCASAATGART
jgi:UDP-glucose 4-epimerase